MSSVLFTKVVDMSMLCKIFTGHNLSSLIGTNDDGTKLKITVDSQALFKYGMYHYDELDGFCESSLNGFFDLLDYLGIDRGSYTPEVRSRIAELCMELVEVGESPYDGDIIRVDESIYVHQHRVLDIIDEPFSRESVKISATPVSNTSWILEEILVD